MGIAPIIKVHYYYYYYPPGARAVWRREGVRGLYRGLDAMALRDVPSYGLYLVVYEAASSWLRARRWAVRHGALGDVLADVVGGGLAGSVSWLAVMPLDVLKSRLQADRTGRYRGLLHCASRAVRREGLGVLYRGTLVTCLRGFPTNAATFLVYTKLLKYLNKGDEADSV